MQTQSSATSGYASTGPENSRREDKDRIGGTGRQSEIYKRWCDTIRRATAPGACGLGAGIDAGGDARCSVSAGAKITLTHSLTPSWGVAIKMKLLAVGRVRERCWSRAANSAAGMALSSGGC